MKTIRFTRRQLVRAVLVASFLAGLSSAQDLVADPVYTSPFYAVDGSTVTASGSSSTAYFRDTSDASYTVNIAPSANLSSVTFDELEIGAGTITNNGSLSSNTSISSGYNSGCTISIGNGSVTNRGSVTTTGSSNYGAAIFIQDGTLRNFGTISSSSSYGVMIWSGTITNEASGVITSNGVNHDNSPVDLGASTTLINAGIVTSTSHYFGVQGEDPCTIRNTGFISGIYFGSESVLLRRASSENNSQNSSYTIINSGKIGGEGQGNAILIFGSDHSIHIDNTAGGVIGDAIVLQFIGPSTLNNAAGATLSGGAFIFGPGVANNAGTSNSSLYVLGNGQVTNTGSVTSSSDYPGIALIGQGTVHNSGNIVSQSSGILLAGNDSSLLTSGGLITSTAAHAIDLTGQNSSVTVQGQAQVNGTIEGTNTDLNNVLHFKLTGLTANQAANFKTYVSGHTNSGSYTFTEAGQPVTYTWADFAKVTD